MPQPQGVEAVLSHFQGEVIGFDEVVQSAARRQGAGAVPGGRLSAAAGRLGFGGAGRRRCKKVPLVVCHDMLPSPVSAFAHYVLPGATFAEKEGTFVNHAGLAQALHWGVTPTGEVRTDGQVFLDLLERRGLVHAPTLRKELAGEVQYLRPTGRGRPGRVWHSPGAAK